MEEGLPLLMPAGGVDHLSGDGSCPEMTNPWFLPAGRRVRECRTNRSQAIRRTALWSVIVNEAALGAHAILRLPHRAFRPPQTPPACRAGRRQGPHREVCGNRPWGCTREGPGGDRLAPRR